MTEQYLIFEHDEFTMKPLLDENGRLVPREDYRITTLNCGGEDFAIACLRANLRYGKNQQREDVKSHHYIISFDPRDGPDHGLTMDKAQALGERFCAEHFPGHQALVCTHPDGHNHSGNIHVHNMILFLLFKDVADATGECYLNEGQRKLIALLLLAEIRSKITAGTIDLTAPASYIPDVFTDKKLSHYVRDFLLEPV